MKKSIGNAIITITRETGRLVARLQVIFIRLSIRYGILNSYHPVPLLGIHVKESREKAVYSRWDAISSELPDSNKPLCVMDIGCNLGFYCIEVANKGHLAIGVDMPNYANSLLIIRKALSMYNVVPIGIKLTPQNISMLPAADCIIMLQLFHHLYLTYGYEASFEMLETVCSKFARILFFEVEDICDDADKTILSLEDFIEFFNKAGLTNISEIYKDTNRSRTLIKVEKQFP